MSVKFTQAAFDQRWLEIGPTAALQNASAGTLMAWFRADAYPAVGTMLLFSVSTGTSAANARLSLELAKSIGATAVPRMGWRRLDADFATSLQAATAIIGLGSTHHIACMLNGATGNVLLYLDAVQVASTTIPTGNFSNTASLNGYNGARGPNGAQPFQGRIQGARCYSREVSQAELQCIFEARECDRNVLEMQHCYRMTDEGPAASIIEDVKDIGLRRRSSLGNGVASVPFFEEWLVSTRARRRH